MEAIVAMVLEKLPMEATMEAEKLEINQQTREILRNFQVVEVRHILH